MLSWCGMWDWEIGYNTKRVFELPNTGLNNDAPFCYCPYVLRFTGWFRVSVRTVPRRLSPARLTWRKMSWRHWWVSRRTRSRFMPFDEVTKFLTKSSDKKRKPGTWLICKNGKGDWMQKMIRVTTIFRKKNVKKMPYFIMHSMLFDNHSCLIISEKYVVFYYSLFLGSRGPC